MHKHLQDNLQKRFKAIKLPGEEVESAEQTDRISPPPEPSSSDSANPSIHDESVSSPDGQNSSSLAVPDETDAKTKADRHKSLSLPSLLTTSLPPSPDTADSDPAEASPVSTNELIPQESDKSGEVNNAPAWQTTATAHHHFDKKPRKWLFVGLAALLIGGGLLSLPKLIEVGTKWQQQAQIDAYEKQQYEDSKVLKLALVPPADRKEQLQTIAAGSSTALDRNRARYLLAQDLLAAYEGGPAVQILENLEVDYPVMGSYILLSRGRGYQLANDNEQAEAVWQQILTDYPDSPTVVKALAKLGTIDQQYWQQAIADYPKHPQTLEILHQQLDVEPDSLVIQQQILQNHPTDGRTAKIIDALLENHTDQLTPEDWQAIGDNNWYRRQFKQAVTPYSKAPRSPQNLYRLARAQQLSDQKAAAQKNYQQLIQTYPDATETATALKRLASLVPPAEGVEYAKRLAKDFPDQAAIAINQQAELLAKFDAAAAQQAWQTLLKAHSNSDEAANYRWRQAKEFAKNGQYSDAWQWARDIASQNPDSGVAPKAVFWIGKWAQKLGRKNDANAAFENVLARYPQSYYAWRSAVLLGWQVGDFNSVRFLNPPVTLPTERPIPPAGSNTFKELYRLGEDTAAIELFTAETQSSTDSGERTELTVNEGFTQGLLKLAQREYLQGINQVLNLRNLDTPEAKQEWQALRQRPDYWQALFPFPYQEKIFSWSQKRQLNPFLVTALIRQESRFEKNIKSSAGATGLMQVMPSTAEWIAPQIDLTDYALTDPEDNINMGTWYFDHTHQTYNNNSALAVASYNAGPGNVSKWLETFDNDDPDEFVEQIPFRETKGYVETVFGNYWNYMRIYDPDVQQLMSRLPKSN